MKVLRAVWGNSLDGSISGAILAEDDSRKKYWYLGSRRNYTTEQEDIDYILKWGQKCSL